MKDTTYRPSMGRIFVAAGALNGALAVAMGAFGAHALRGGIDDALMRAFETSAQYHGTHALALLGIGTLLHLRESPLLSAAGWVILTGILLFCGSLYGMALGGGRALAVVTPVGGLCFIAGWVLFALGAWRGTVR